MRFIGIYFVCVLGLNLAAAQGVVNTPHNLSVSGTGSIVATSESEICIFCHTPHNSSPKAPLWNRSDPGQSYTLYNSSTIEATPGQPDGASLLCLSCHDGTIALGNVLSRTQDISMSGGVTVMPDGSSNITQNLADDHPISFQYDIALANADGELVDPNLLTAEVKLENGRMQCTACHDPHKMVNPDFLVASNRNSDLCLYCHDKQGWSNSRHSKANAT